ncbi:ciliary rootlet coiled-coil protein 2-like [Elgaria multicarinata webbii]|uniref:ciliary rootlet coiled-coil protein 2-like n=1 Tax=Elgaria multicarinata webbii TaxID=159646 RepID=UPI002FCD3B20
MEDTLVPDGGGSAAPGPSSHGSPLLAWPGPERVRCQCSGGFTMAPKRRGKTQAQPAGRAPASAAEGAAGPRPEAVSPAPLQEEYARLCQALEGLRGRRARLRAQHDFLQQEAQSLRADSMEFVGYLAKRAQRRQGAAVSLSEESRAALAEVQQQHRQLVARAQEQEAALRGQVLQKEAELARLGAELDGLRGVQALQRQQAGRLRELQQELAAMRAQKVQRLQAAKARLGQETAARERGARHEAACWAQQAQQAAERCLQEHGRAAGRQNHALGQELDQLVRRARALQAHKQQLQERVQRLRQEQACLRDLAMLRHAAAGPTGGSLAGPSRRSPLHKTAQGGLACAAAAGAASQQSREAPEPRQKEPLRSAGLGPGTGHPVRGRRLGQLGGGRPRAWQCVQRAAGD